MTLARGDLPFCGHHYGAHAEALAKAAMWAASEFAALTDHATDAMVRQVTGASLVVNRAVAVRGRPGMLRPTSGAMLTV